MKVAKEWVYEILWSCKILGTDPMKPLILLAIVGPVPKNGGACPQNLSLNY